MNELQSISPTLAKIAPVNPYIVPKGYFENLSSEVLILVRSEEPSKVFGNTTTTPYQIPANYFANFPEQVLAIIKGDKASSILPGKSHPTYQVPGGYFDGLAESILRRVKSDDGLSAKEELESLSPFLSKLDKKSPFSIPAGYFEDLSGSVVGGMKAIEFVNDEIETLSSLMSNLKRETVYEVPDNYFQNLPSLILDRVRQHQPARVVSMTFGKKMMRYAAAAVITGIIITAGLLFMNRSTSDADPAAIALSDEKIQRETQTKVEGLSDDELVNFLENQTAPLPDILGSAANAEIGDEDIKMMLADIPDAELKQYLAEYSDDKEVLTN